MTTIRKRIYSNRAGSSAGNTTIVIPFKGTLTCVDLTLSGSPTLSTDWERNYAAVCLGDIIPNLATETERLITELRQDYMGFAAGNGVFSAGLSKVVYCELPISQNQSISLYHDVQGVSSCFAIAYLWFRV